MSIGLYTVTLDFYDSQEVWIEQLSVPSQNPRDVLSAWGKLATKRKLVSQEDNELLQEELDDADYTPVPLDGLSNIWYTSMLLNSNKAHVGLHVIKTDVKPCQSDCDHVVHACTSDKFTKAKYAQYEEQYCLLKGEKSRDKMVNKKRKHIERWMRYWRIKMRFLNCGSASHQGGYREGLYTIIFDYGGGKYCSQLLLSGTYSDFLLANWVKILLKKANTPRNEKIIDNERGRVTLMEKATDVVYQPVPLNGLVNVWGTYFSLDKGIANLTIIKTVS
jgi:hypothetical protein